MNGAAVLKRARRSLFGEFMAVITLIVLLLVAVLGWYAWHAEEQITTHRYLINLQEIALEKDNAIRAFINRQIAQVRLLGRMAENSRALEEIAAGFRQGGVDAPACREASARHRDRYFDLLTQGGYYDLFLIDLDGNIVFTIKHERDFGTNLNDPRYRNNGLAKVYRAAIERMEVTNSAFAFYPPSQEPAGFVATPLFDHGLLVGALAIQFDTKALYEEVNDLIGLGDSGEVVLARRLDGQHLQAIAPLRHDPDAAFKRTFAVDGGLSRPIIEATQGISGMGVATDWRGKRVMAVWHYLPALKAGMVVKVDVDEAMAPWRVVARTLLGVVALGMLLAYLLIYRFARSRTEPLSRLTAASYDYIAGDGSVDISDVAAINNETGVLADALGKMLAQIERGKAEQQRLLDDLAENNRQLDRRVAEQTAHLRAVIDHAADGIVVIDSDGIMQRVNPAVEAMFGYAEADLLGEDVTMLMPAHYRADHRHALERRRRSDDAPLMLSVELEGVRRSGEEFPLDIHVAEMRVGGERLFLGILRDISKRRKLEAAQRQLSLAVAHAEDAIFITDRNGVINYVNPAYARLSGYSADELIGKTPKMMKSGKMEKAFYQRMWKAILSGRQWRAEFVNRRRDGTLYEVDQSISPIKDDVGQVTGFVSVQRDITKEKQQREQLEHTQRLESLGVLAGGIAHDFNNLLTAILGNAALAKMRLEPTSPAVEMLDNVENASERAAALCKQMLAYSGKGKFVVEQVNLSELVEEMTSLLSVSISKSVVMRFDLSPQLPPIEADVAQMQQVVMNLVINASEAIGDRSGIITIHTGAVEVDADYIKTTYLKEHIQPGRYVALEVSDTGCGMDEETRKKIFDPFFTTKFTGRGLGMSAILGIVRGHHGAIKLYSEKGKGTTFKLLFPCAALEGGEQGKARGEEQRVVGSGSGTVLVVDDEETIRVTAAAMLEDAGFTVLTAEDGAAGVEMFRQRHDEIRAVLLDMTMPRMGGEEAFRHMRQIDPDVKVVLSSGYNEQDATSHFAGKGLAGFIQKPYSPKALQAKFVQLLAE